MRIVAARVYPYTLPFRRSMLTARGNFRQRPGYLLELVDDADRHGWGDAAPWTGFASSPLELVQRALHDISDVGIVGEQINSVQDIRTWLAERALPNEALYAAELALLDLLGRQQRQSIAKLLAPGAGAPPVPLSAVAFDAADALEQTAQGFATLKIKVGVQPWLEEHHRVRSIRDAVGPDTRLRLDANEAWRGLDPESVLADLASLDIEWLEQPAPSWTEWVGHGTPIAADESIGRALAQAETSREVADLLAGADVWVLKPMYVGGLLGAMELAREAGARTVSVSSSWESAIGRVGALHLSVALAHVRGENPAAGLSSPLAHDLAQFPELTAGAVRLPVEPGLGIAPIPSALGPANAGTHT